MSRNSGKLEFLSLSCPRPTEFVLRSKEVNKKEVVCQRGNVTILEDLFKILGSREIEELRFHLVEIHPEDLKVFGKKLKKSGCFQVNGFVFNQSADPQLIIDFSLKSPSLEFLMVKGYNQKYPCNRTDFLIKVYTRNNQSAAHIIKSQVPLICQPIEWSYKNRKQFLTEKLPRHLLYSNFIMGTEFFFNEPITYSNIYKNFKIADVHTNLLIVANINGVYYKLKYTEKLRKRPERRNPKSLLTLLNFFVFPLDSPKKNRMLHSVFPESEEEWDAVEPSHPGLLDMPMNIIENILGKLKISEMFNLRKTCSSFRSFIDSNNKFIFVKLHDTYAVVDFKKTFCPQEESKMIEVYDFLLRNGKINTLSMRLSLKGMDRLMRETTDEPIRVGRLLLHEPSQEAVTYMLERCRNSLKVVSVSSYSIGSVYKQEHFLQLFSVKFVRIHLNWRENFDRIVDEIVELWTRKDAEIGFTLIVDHNHPVPLDSLRAKFAEREISYSEIDRRSSLRIKTDNELKHVLFKRDRKKTACQVIRADMATKGHVIQYIHQ